ncbi:MAG: tetratricopeptide repeat protein [Chloroflexi bacterium]|nr:tetratricopeptide repeat protein [Chloroflexota bacterium]
MPADSTTTFGALLRQHRIAAGLTQESLAERAGLSVYGIQKLERGTTHPYRDTAERLLTALQLGPIDAERLRTTVEPVRRHGSPPLDGAVRKVRHNLPVAMTSFVGRERELVEIPDRLRRARLMTLTGVGGSGKTRLAIEVAKRVVDRYGDGVWLVELAQVADPGLVPHRLANVVGVRASPDRAIEGVLCDALRDASVLLVLDNCEHLLDASAVLIDLVLRDCPELQILATSREPIGIPGEISWPVLPLTSPEASPRISFDDVQRSPAVCLFADRASAAVDRFTLDEETAPTIAHICRRLDGIPLALELAAACLDALTPRQLAARLDRPFRLLTAGNRAAPPRQQTLTATIDWSYQLLSDTQRRVFERLSVFASGWTLDAAEAVCADENVPPEHVLEAVVQLVRKSLVVNIGDERYHLLETLREYALDRLRARGELEAIRERHATYYSRLVERLDPAGSTRLLAPSHEGGVPRAMETLDEAQDNVRAALRWWLEAQRANEGLGLVRALGPLWAIQGVPADGRRWVEAIFDLADRKPEEVSAALHAQALMFGAIFARIQRDFTTGRVLLERCVAIWRTLEDDLGLSQGLSNLGANQLFMGDFDQAEASLSESLALARAAGEPFTTCLTLNQLGTLAQLRNQYDRAQDYLRESLRVGRTLERPGDRSHIVGRALVLLGRALSEQGDFTGAMACFRVALSGGEADLVGPTLGQLLAWTAAVLGATGEPLRATRLFGAADSVWLASGTLRYPFDDAAFERDLRRVQAQLDDAAFASALAEGRAMSAVEAIAYALHAAGLESAHEPTIE